MPDYSSTNSFQRIIWCSCLIFDKSRAKGQYNKSFRLNSTPSLLYTIGPRADYQYIFDPSKFVDISPISRAKKRDTNLGPCSVAIES